MAKKKLATPVDTVNSIDSVEEVVAETTPVDEPLTAAEVIEAATAGDTETEGAGDRAETSESGQDTAAAAPRTKQPRERSRKYREARSLVDRTLSYPLEQALELLTRTSYTRFDGTVTAHINLKREVKPFEVTFPHSTGKELRVAIATDDLLSQVEAGEINFDILIADPKMMPKLAKFAKVLGPKGLMPNPKAGTVSTDPEAKKKALEGGAIMVRPEKKANLLHVRVGKVSQPTGELRENIEALLKAVQTLNVEKLTIAATMSPGIKVVVVEQE